MAQRPRIALTRPVSPSIGQCELTHVSRGPIDVGRAREQHASYRDLLAELCCTVISLPELPDQPDAVFVEDMAVVLDELAILTRSGAESRRGESDSVASALTEFRSLHQIEAPGTMDGGDVLCVGRAIFVGRSSRTNPAAIEQLRAVVRIGGSSPDSSPVNLHAVGHHRLPGSGATTGALQR
jgi:dimethylargininase